MARVFELVQLCSDLRADAASERGAVPALQGQLFETRRETADLHRRVALAEARMTTAPIPEAAFPPEAALSSQTRPGAAVGPHGDPLSGVPVRPTRSYAAALQAGVPPHPGLDAPTARQAPALHEHVAFVTPITPSATPARDSLRILKANIDPAAHDICDVTIRHTSYGLTVFARSHNTLHNMRQAILDNAITCASLSMRIPERRQPHVRFSGVDPDVATDEFIARINDRNPQSQLDPDTCKVRATFRERSGTSAVIVEVDPAAFQRVMQRISIGWTSVRVTEDLHVSTCTFCATYGHGRSSCPLRNQPERAVCTRCGTEGHTGSSCHVRSGDPSVCCVECRRAGLDETGHTTGFSQCPLLLDRVARLRARTNYGGDH
ncbi:hypothetical protein HPB52_023789 [Rhipicephalus sanguineus]|uniref:CCHC-type domain-containing protein n=1 Tax=Rhipicephalus sanguineus TaxID=34632 RepID=A0A9D4T285_RHISA|nr:hypothetical protein HPB52_023789 [Rhipicephalus sanguineus]